MKKSIFTFVALLALILLPGCGNKDVPLTEAEQAEQYGMTMEEYNEAKAAAARMNMTMEDHMSTMSE